jgi:hypothetical protein
MPARARAGRSAVRPLLDILIVLGLLWIWSAYYLRLASRSRQAGEPEAAQNRPSPSEESEAR